METRPELAPADRPGAGRSGGRGRPRQRRCLINRLHDPAADPHLRHAQHPAGRDLHLHRPEHRLRPRRRSPGSPTARSPALPVSLFLVAVAALGAHYPAAALASSAGICSPLGDSAESDAPRRHRACRGSCASPSCSPASRPASPASSSPAGSAPAIPMPATAMELDAIVAVVLGGTSLAGGRVSIVGILTAVLLLGVLNNLLNLLQVADLHADPDQGADRHRRHPRRPAAATARRHERLAPARPTAAAGLVALDRYAIWIVLAASAHRRRRWSRTPSSRSIYLANLCGRRRRSASPRSASPS